MTDNTDVGIIAALAKILIDEHLQRQALDGATLPKGSGSMSVRLDASNTRLVVHNGSVIIEQRKNYDWLEAKRLRSPASAPKPEAAPGSAPAPAPAEYYDERTGCLRPTVTPPVDGQIYIDEFGRPQVYRQRSA